MQSFNGLQERVYPTALTLRDAPTWFPDSSALLFAMAPEGAVGDSTGRTWRFVRLDLATGTYREVGSTSAAGLVRIAGLTGRSLFYLLGVDRVMALDWQTGATREVFRFPRDGGDLLTDVAVLGEGERIALAIRHKNGSATVSVLTPPAKDPVSVGEVAANSRAQLVWCSDGKWILVSGVVAGKQGIWRIPADGGEPQRLSLEETGITEVRLGGDGKRIAFTRRIPRPNEVWAYRHSDFGPQADPARPK